MSAVRAHATPFYCPYCGEEDLVPRENHGEWSCQACRRGFRVSLTALATAPAPARPPAFRPDPAGSDPTGSDPAPTAPSSASPPRREDR